MLESVDAPNPELAQQYRLHLMMYILNSLTDIPIKAMAGKCDNSSYTKAFATPLHLQT
jgi:hypothetical protein